MKNTERKKSTGTLVDQDDRTVPVEAAILWPRRRAGTGDWEWELKPVFGGTSQLILLGA